MSEKENDTMLLVRFTVECSMLSNTIPSLSELEQAIEFCVPFADVDYRVTKITGEYDWEESK